MATKKTKRRADLGFKEVRFRASREDCKRLAALSKHYEMTESGVLRRLIADAARVVATP